MKTEAEKKASGTDRADRKKPDPMDLPLTEIPKPPVGFTNHQIEFYMDECSYLHSVNSLTRNRLKRVELGSMWWHLYKKSSIELRNDYIVEYKTGAQQITPEITVLEKSTRWLQSYFVDRDKMKVTPAKKENDLDKII